MKGVKGWAIDCLKKPKTIYQQEEGRRIIALRERTEAAKSWMVGRLKEPKTGDHRGEGSKKATLRVIELSSVPGLQLPYELRTAPPRFHLYSVKVKEREVSEVDSNGL